MEWQKHKKYNSVYVMKCNSSEQLFEFLRPNNRIWSGKEKEWIFRGQKDSNWSLQPNAFRKNTKFYLSNGKKEVGPKDILKEQVNLEYEAVKYFVSKASNCGLKTPGDCYEFRNFDIHHNFDTNCIHKTWPPDNFMETYALAQHHGIPTRLLDFTHSSYIACFFAIRESLLDMENEKLKNDQQIAIWGINKIFVSEIKKKRLKMISVPSADNEFLYNQKGLFLLDAKCNDIWGKPNHNIENDTDILHIIENEWKNKSVSFKKQYKKNSDFYPIRLLTFSKTNSKEMLMSIINMLEKEEVSLSRLLPNFCNVVKEIEENNKWFHTNSEY